MPKVVERCRRCRRCVVAGAIGWALWAMLALPARAQDEPATSPQVAERAPTDSNGRVGYIVDVPLPIRGQAADHFLSRLESLAESVDSDSRQRTTVVLRFGSGAAEGRAAEGDAAADGRGSTFADSVALARFLSGGKSRLLHTVAYLTGPVEGHAVLAVLACDEFVVAPGSHLGNASADEADADEAVMRFYQSIAAGRGIVPEAAVRAMVDSRSELYRVTEVEGAERFVDAEQLAELRKTGAVWKEDRLAGPAGPAIFAADRLREYRWASHVASGPTELAQQLGLSKLIEPSVGTTGELTAMRLDVRGPITSSRVRRFRANIAAAVDGEAANAVLVTLDSPGGDLESSLQLAMMLSDLDGGRGVSIGYVAVEARGDAALIAAACKPLYMHPDAILGGSGAAAVGPEDIAELRGAIEALAEQVNRPAALLIALIDPSAEVYRYVNRRTGQVAYFASEDFPEDSADQWRRDRRVQVGDGLTAAEAVALGLAEGDADSVALAATRAGLDSIPPAIQDRGVVRTVEWLGGLPFLAPLLVFIGFMALSMEVSAPGLGVPGFIALLCFLTFFWMKFLSGTAEWLEVVLFAGGVVCILIEVLILPGVGVFGIGGMLMVVSAILLTSQTFVIPQNDYQMRQTTRSLLSVLAACGGIAVGLIALRFILPGTPLFRHLVMPGPLSDEMIEQEQREHLVRYEWLRGRRGVAVTPLRPAGKARFDDQVIAVISDGSPLSPGDEVQVIQVQGNRVVVEPVYE